MNAKDFYKAVENMRNAQLKYDSSPSDANKLAKLEAEFVIDLERIRVNAILAGQDPTARTEQVKNYYNNLFLQK